MVASATVTPDQRALVIHNEPNGRPGAILDSREPGFILGSRPSPLRRSRFADAGVRPTLVIVGPRKRATLMPGAGSDQSSFESGARNGSG
jgi:hypothetical protein